VFAKISLLFSARYDFSGRFPIHSEMVSVRGQRKVKPEMMKERTETVRPVLERRRN
jgi:hypothetical protein